MRIFNFIILMNQIDELIFTLTERLNDEIKIIQRLEYNQKIRKIYIEHLDDYKSKLMKEAPLFFKKLILLSGCEEPQKYYSLLNRYLHQALNNPNFDSIPTQSIFDLVTPQTNVMNIYKWYKNTLIENILLESKITELKNICRDLLYEKNLITAEENRQSDQSVKDKSESQCIKRGERIRGDLYLLMDDMNRKLSNI